MMIFIGGFEQFLLSCCIGSVVTSLWYIYFQLKRIADKYTEEQIDDNF